jgi:hypothetical protein
MSHLQDLMFLPPPIESSLKQIVDLLSTRQFVKPIDLEASDEQIGTSDTPIVEMEIPESHADEQPSTSD